MGVFCNIILFLIVKLFHKIFARNLIIPWPLKIQLASYMSPDLLLVSNLKRILRYFLCHSVILFIFYPVDCIFYCVKSKLL